MKLILAALVVATLSACSLLPANVNQIEEGIAQAVVQSSERTICRNIPIGTWIRLYGANPERVRGWQSLCFNPITTPLNDATVAAILKVYPGFQQAQDAASTPPLPLAEGTPLGTGIRVPQ